MDVEATPANRLAEVASTRDMIDRVEARFAPKPQRLIGDTAYGVAPMLGWLVETKGIAPHVPVWDKTQRDDGTFSGGDFQWDEQADQYRCRAGKTLRPRQKRYKNRPSRVTKENTIIYATGKADCLLKSQCCPNTPIRKIKRSVHEGQGATSHDKLPEPRTIADPARRERRSRILFADLKRIMKLDRLRLRGINGARDEFLLAATVRNLRRMAKLLSQPPPDRRISVPA